jgi:hypothetical protein
MAANDANGRECKNRDREDGWPTPRLGFSVPLDTEGAPSLAESAVWSLRSQQKGGSFRMVDSRR